MSISLNNLPDIDFTIKDIDKIKSEMINGFEKIIGRTLYPGDPLRLLLLSFAKYFELLQCNIDLSAKQNLIKYAEDGYIENIGALMGVKRQDKKPSCVSIKFTLSEIQENSIIIPKGTRVTCNDEVYFQTVCETEIKAGEISKIVKAECTEAGTIGNGYFKGQINNIVDTFGYLVSVENVTESTGGTDKESIESFKERILIAPEKFSSAGPSGAYEYWVKTANQDIYDVSVTSPSAGEVEIIPLMKNGLIPSNEILKEIEKICSADDKRPLTDKVFVSAPIIINYDIDLTYFISKNNSTSGLTIQENVKKAISNFIYWQREKLSRDINPSKLVQCIMEAGAKRVDIISPIYKKIEYNQIAVSNNVNIIYGGAEDD